MLSASQVTKHRRIHALVQPSYWASGRWLRKETASKYMQSISGQQLARLYMYISPPPRLTCKYCMSSLVNRAHLLNPVRGGFEDERKCVREEGETCPRLRLSGFGEASWTMSLANFAFPMFLHSLVTKEDPQSNVVDSGDSTPHITDDGGREDVAWLVG